MEIPYLLETNLSMFVIGFQCEVGHMLCFRLNSISHFFTELFATLGYNTLYGSIPSQIGQWEALEYIGFGK